jgi:hypothetical protein
MIQYVEFSRNVNNEVEIFVQENNGLKNLSSAIARYLMQAEEKEIAGKKDEVDKR